MALSNTAVPKYYGEFRDAVIHGRIPINEEISMEMNRIDGLIADPGIYYDGEKVEVLSVRLNEPTPRSLYELNLPGFELDASN